MASVINQIKLGSVEYAIAASAYAECSTAAGTAAKVATICTDSDTTNTAFTLIKGVSVQVKFTNTNTAANPTLNVNATGAKSIYHGGSAISTKALKAGDIYTFTYNGTQWELVSLPTAGYNTLGLIKTTSSVTTPTGYTACPIVDGVPLYMNTTYTHPTGEGNRHVPAGDQLKHGYHLVYDFNSKAAVWEAARQVPTGGSANNYLGWSSSGTAAWKTGFGKVADNGSSGVILGTNLTSNTLTTYGGGHSVVSGVSNTVNHNVSHAYVFGESNSIDDTSDEGTSEGVSRYLFFAGYGNKLNTTYPRSTGSVAIGLNNTVCSGKTSNPSSMTSSTAYLCGSVALGSGNTAGSSSSAGYAIGGGNTATGAASVAIGRQNTASSSYCTAIGYDNSSSSTYCTTLGYSNVANTTGCTAIGYNNDAKHSYATIIGYGNISNGAYSHAFGRYLYANQRQTVIGYYNNYSATSSAGPSSDGTVTVGNTSAKSVFQVGAGSSSSRANVMNLCNDGTVYFVGNLNAANADYAECFEWSDGNPEKEDRRGRFVTIDDGSTIRLANPDDDYILGIVSGAPTIIGDACGEDWHGRFLRDVYGTYLYEDVEYPAEYDEEGNEIVPAYTDTLRKPNPEYDSSKTYIPRLHRPEWSAIGMMGKLVLDDDGTCNVNDYVTVGENGIGTKGTRANGYRVIERIDDSHVKVIFK